MKILWITLSFIVILIGCMIALGAGASFEGQQRINLTAAAIGQIFGLPVLVIIIAAFFKEHRKTVTLFKVFSLFGIMMICITIAGR